MTRRALAAAALVAASLAACRSARTPPPPLPPRGPTTTAAAGPSLLEQLQTGGTPALQPYLDAYPLGDQGSRVDLLAADSVRSMHFVQTRRAAARHVYAERTETVYVLRGTGTCYLADRSYPIRPGSAFRIAPGVAQSAIPDVGETIVAVSYIEPPMTGDDDRALVE